MRMSVVNLCSPHSSYGKDVGNPWFSDVAQEVFEGAHVVVDVPPGGETYSLTFLAAADESMAVRGRMEFVS